MKFICSIIVEGENFFLVVGEGTREKVAATGRDHVDFFTEVKLELFVAMLRLFDSSLSLSECVCVCQVSVIHNTVHALIIRTFKNNYSLHCSALIRKYINCTRCSFECKQGGLLSLSTVKIVTFSDHYERITGLSADLCCH